MLKKIRLKEAIEFAKENSYLFAIYKRGDDKNFHLLSDIFFDEIDDYTEIMVEVEGSGLCFREFTTVDGQHCFRLHNNLNVPKIIPTFSHLWTGILASKLIPNRS